MVALVAFLHISHGEQPVRVCGSIESLPRFLGVLDGASGVGSVGGFLHRLDRGTKYVNWYLVRFFEPKVFVSVLWVGLAAAGCAMRLAMSSF